MKKTGKPSKKRKTLLICTVVAVLIIGFLIWQDSSYVRLIDAIGEKDNQKVEKLLKRPYFSLDKVSGHIPFRWMSDMGERNSPLEQACQCGNNEAAKMLIAKGADASIVQDGHFSLLYLAMEETDEGDYDLVKLLVENGADPKGAPDEHHDMEPILLKCAYMDCSDYHFNSFLQKYNGIKYNKEAHMKCRYDKNRAEMILKIYKYLEDETGCPEVEDDFGITPLHIAAGSQNIELAKYLLEENKYDINDKNMWGSSCIFSICNKYNPQYDRKWKREIFELLIENGADPNIKNNEGETVYDKVIEAGDDYLAGLLEPYMNK